MRLLAKINKVMMFNVYNTIFKGKHPDLTFKVWWQRCLSKGIKGDLISEKRGISPVLH
jgi:hypothetical protein